MDRDDRAAPGTQDGGTPSPLKRQMGRRRLLKGTAAVAGGVTLAGYTRPTLQALGVPAALAVSGPEIPGLELSGPPPVQGSPGFWKDRGSGQTSLWDTAGDIDWQAWAQKLGLAPASPTNPFAKTDPFTTLFAAHPDLAGLTMQQVIEIGEGGTASQKAARSLVAAYLDASLYGSRYAYTQDQLKTLWQQAVTANTPASFDALKTLLETTYN